MSTRRSGRAKAAVKYTSDSDNSDFGASKPKKSASKKKDAPAPPKMKGTKRQQSPAAEEAGAPTTTAPAKRRKKDASTLAAEHTEKARQQEEKAQKQQHKKSWEDWQKDNDAAGELLDNEPDREESITQTDCQKKYSLKPTELGSLLHFEKKNSYGGTMKLFLEEDVKELAFRKYGMLAGAADEKGVLEKGEELWKEEHGDDAIESSPPKKKEKEPKPAKARTPKQKWTDYVAAHALASDDDNAKLTEEPEEVINQTECKTKYSLTPQDLACLPHFQKKNPAYGNTIKLFKESEVKVLAYRKAAVTGGVEESDDEALLEKGKELFEEK